MNIVDPIVTGYIFSELYNQVGEGVSNKSREEDESPTHETQDNKSSIRLNFSGAYPMDSIIKDLPEELKNKMVPIGLVKIDANIVLPSLDKIKEDDMNEMVPEDIFNKLIDSVSAPFPKKMMKRKTQKLRLK